MKTQETFRKFKKAVKDEIGKVQSSGFKLLTNYYPKDAKDQIDDIFAIIEKFLPIQEQPVEMPTDRDIKKWADNEQYEVNVLVTDNNDQFKYLLVHGAKAMRDGKITKRIKR